MTEARLPREILKIEDLVFRRFELADTAPFTEILGHPEMRAFLSEEEHGTSEAFLENYRKLIGHPSVENWVVLKIGERELSPIGIVDIYPTPAQFRHEEIAEGTYCVGMWLDPRRQGQGIGKKALSFMMLHTFETKPDLNWIQGSCFTTGTKGRRLAHSVGFHFYKTKPYAGQTDCCYLKHRDPHFDYAYGMPSRPELEPPIPMINDASL